MKFVRGEGSGGPAGNGTDGGRPPAAGSGRGRPPLGQKPLASRGFGGGSAERRQRGGEGFGQARPRGEKPQETLSETTLFPQKHGGLPKGPRLAGAAGSFAAWGGLREPAGQRGEG